MRWGSLGLTLLALYGSSCGDDDGAEDASVDGGVDATSDAAVDGSMDVPFDVASCEGLEAPTLTLARIAIGAGTETYPVDLEWSGGTDQVEAEVATEVDGEFAVAMDVVDASNAAGGPAPQDVEGSLRSLGRGARTVSRQRRSGATRQAGLRRSIDLG